MTDRHRLAVWSLELDDDGFVRACAALGVLTALARGSRRGAAELLHKLAAAGSDEDVIKSAISVLVAARGEDGIIDWQMPSTAALARFPSASVLAEAWRAFLDNVPWGTRIALRRRGRGWGGLLPLLRNLQQPAVGAAGVFFADAFAADGRVDWHLPFHVAVLPDDALAEAFSGFRAHWREPWPYRFVVANRALPHVEILVLGGPLRRAAGRLLTKGAPCRATLVLVLGGLEGGGDVESLTRIVAGELSAEGVVCVATPANGDAQWAMQALVSLGDELTHNRPLDVALSQTFGSGTVAFLSRDLVRLSHLSHAVLRIAGRLKALPADVSLAVSTRSLSDLIQVHEYVGALALTQPEELGVRGLPAGAAPLPPGLVRSVSPKLLARSMGASSRAYRYFHESDEASSLTEVTNEVTALEAARAAEQPETRYVQHSFWRKEEGALVEERRRLTVGTALLLRVRIGPPGQHWQSAPEPFPAHELPRQQRRHRIQIVFHEPTQFDAPMVGALWLPRSGPSSVAEFVFTPRRIAPFEGRISVLHRGRVLQTVLIQARVVAPGEEADGGQAIVQQVEARVREHWSDLGARRRFDASFVLNHTNEQRPLLTGISGKRAWATDLGGIEEPLATINQLLSDVAYSVADYSRGLTEGDNPKLLFKLARVGADLYSALVIDHLQRLRSGEMDVEEATHIQIVSTRDDAVVPFEFIYQYLPPEDESDCKLCPNALEALAAGACPGNCDGQKEPQRHVCPMGFWGLRKVIERHIYNPAIGKLDQAEVIVQAEPAGNRVRLELDQTALVGYSNEVKAEEVVPLIHKLRGCMKGAVQEVKDWDEWKAAISDKRPTLLVAFPHNTGDKQDIALEIGGKLLKTMRLSREPGYVHVDGPFPLVMLLGCDVASTGQPYSRHVRYFRQAGAAAIVLTIATVFGPHAVTVGEKLLEGLLALRGQAEDPSGAPCLGEALREVKRKALLDSMPMALCVVAFGDADWRL